LNPSYRLNRRINAITNFLAHGKEVFGFNKQRKYKQASTAVLVLNLFSTPFSQVKAEEKSILQKHF